MNVVFNEALPTGGRVRVELASERLVRLSITPAAAFCDFPSYAIERKSWPEVACRVNRSEDGAIACETDSLRIRMRIVPFELSVSDAFGNRLFETKDNGLQVDGPKVRIARRLDGKEAIYGLGEHGETLNRNPGVYRIWNRDDPHHHPHKQFYCTIPFGMSLPGDGRPPHGFFVDNPGEVTVDVGREDPEALQLRTHTGEFHLWLFFEESPAGLLAEYTELTGRMMRPPLWALGYHQSRWSYMSRDEVRRIADEFRARRIPCDVIHLDIDYMDRYRVFTWNEDTFPTPESLTAEFKNDGFTLVTIVDPGVAIAEDYHVYTEGARTAGFFLCDVDGRPIVTRVWPGEVHHPDFTNPKARELWGEWQREALLDKGIGGIWNDMNEPAIFGSSTITEDYAGDAVHEDHSYFRAHRHIHNVYGLCMARASCEGQVEARPDRRPFTLTRSGWAGIQKWSAVWTGDNASSFSSMPTDIVLNLSMGLSGVAFVGCDIGGFGGNASPELFARWMEWGVFQPFCRGHSSLHTIHQEPWAFGAATEAVSRRMLEWRYRLLPYIYTLFVESSETGMPVNRALALEYPGDATCLSIGDEFLLGSDILVAPILMPGTDRRSVYLPPGNWYHLWSGACLEGGSWHLAEAPYGRPPVYIRAGAVLPMHPARQSTRQPEPEVMFLDVYPGRQLAGKLVEDDGRTMAYRDGEDCRVLFSGEEDAKGLRLSIGAPQGSYRSARKKWVVRIHGRSGRISAISCDGKATPFETEGETTVIEIADDRHRHMVEVSYRD